MSKHALSREVVTSPDGTVLSEEVDSRGLYSSKPTIPADGQTERIIGFSWPTADAPNDVDFDVSGDVVTVTVQEHPNHPEYSFAEITIVTSDVGTIRVEARSETLKIDAVDPNG